MAIPASFEALSAHPAPGLHFPPHAGAGSGERIVASPHLFAEPASAEDLGILREKTKACPRAQAELSEFYSRWNGVGVCCLQLPEQAGLAASVCILPIGMWASFTDELSGEDLGWMLEGLEDMYVPGRFLVIGVSPCEETRLVLFTEGRYDGQDLAGKVFCISMDPVLSFTEPVAGSFNGLLEAIGSDPVGFLNSIGFSHVRADAQGQIYGDVPDAYLPDCEAVT